MLNVKLFRYLLFHNGIQLVRLHVRGLAPCHNDKIVPLVRFLPDFRLYSAEGLSDNPSGTASFYRTADFFGGNDSKSVDTPFCGLKITHKGAVYNACSLFEKIAKFSVFFYAYVFFGIIHSLVRKSRSALIASAGDYLSSVRGRHSFSEAVLHLSLTLFRLICSFHFNQSFPNQCSVFFVRKTPFPADSFNIISHLKRSVKGFLRKINK